MPEQIPYGRQWIDDEDVAAVTTVLRGDFLTTGPAIPAFEAALAAASGARYAVAVNSGTAALHAMYFAAGIRAGDEVVTSPLTFAATGNAALYLGATVRFADVDPATGNLDPEKVEPLVGPRTRAIIAVDYAGQPADYGALRRIAERHGLALLADAAHSLGATDGGRSVGTLADASALSFHPVKPITTAEGGAVLTGDSALAATAARFRTHGITRDAEVMGRNDGPWFYEQHDLGFNYRLTDILAALGTSQLRHLEAFITRRRRIAARYDVAFADLEAIETPSVREDVQPGWHLYVVMVRDATRRRTFFERLRELGLGVQVHYIPIYHHPYYRRLGFEPGGWPVAEDRYRRSVSLPIFPRMTDADVDSVIERVRSAVAEVL
ncbi:MAG: UDP-4-amino-4,6-dideoxy-N-acetyl-beta-L-altrosamine transaminase [Candidatus Limnocylindria bacterium]